MFDLKQRCGSVSNAWDPTALLSLLSYFDVIQRSFCEVLLQVESTYFHCVITKTPTSLKTPTNQKSPLLLCRDLNLKNTGLIYNSSIE